MESNDWIILGAGELGREIYNIFFKNTKKKLIYFVDDYVNKKKILNKKIIKFKNLPKLKKSYNYVLAILDTKVRKKKILQLSKHKNFIPENLFHEKNFFYNNFKIGKGNIFYPNSNINYSSKIGNFNILQFNSSIGHNSKIQNNCFIGSNSTISSNCLLKENIFIGANSNISRNIKIDSGSHISPSSHIYKNIKKSSRVISIPRLIISKN